jgi:hypothetical protein
VNILRLSKGLVLLIVVSITMFLAGFGGGVFSAPSVGFVRVETVTRQVPILITQTITAVNTTTVTSTTTATAIRVETYTSTVPVTTTIVQTAFMPTTVTRTETITLTLNMPATYATEPSAKVSRGSSIKVNDWTISIATCYRQVVANTSIAIVGNSSTTIARNSTYYVIVLQLRNDAPWARAIDLAMLSKVILVTSSGRSYEPIAINATKGFIAPGSYGFAEVVFSIDENESPSYLYTEILTHDKPVKVEFEL